MAYYKCGSVYVTNNSDVRIGSASGGVANFNTSLALPLVSCEVDENATKVYARGINLWDEQYQVGGYRIENGTYNSGWTNRLCSKNMIRVEPDSYVFYKSGEGITLGNIFYYDINKNFISYEGNKGNAVCHIPNNCYFVNFTLATAYGITYNNDCGINYPSSDTEYHSYNSNSADYDVVDIANIKTLVGTNNLFADSGNCEVEYKKLAND